MIGKFTGIVGVIFLGFLALMALKSGLADLNAVAANKLSAAYSSKVTGLHSEQEWRQPLKLMHRARELAPLNANHALSMANQYSAGLQDDEQLRDPDDVRKMLKQYQDAVRLRPSWAAAWAALAVEWYSYYGIDRRTQVALERATTLGPWEPEVIARISWLTMHAWSELPPELQQKTWSFIRDAVRDPARKREIKRQAKEAGWSGFFRRLEGEVQREALSKSQAGSAVR